MSIFVNLAAFNEPLLEFTLDSLFGQAKTPAAIYVGLVDQSNDNNRARLNGKSYWRQIRYVQIDPIDARGVSWARSIAFSLYQGETHLLQIDSHTWFDPGWDEQLVNDLSHLQTLAAKPLLTTYPPPFEFDDNNQPFKTLKPAATIYAMRVHPETQLSASCATLRFRVEHVRGGEFLEGYHIGAGFLFAPGSFVQEVPYDPYMYFHGEEQNLALRAYTHGWTIYHPLHDRIPLYHLYKQKDNAYRTHHWHPDYEAQRAVKWSELKQRADQRLLDLIRAPQRNGRYGLGTVRSLADFMALSGIDYLGMTAPSPSVAEPPAMPATPSAKPTASTAAPATNTPSPAPTPAPTQQKGPPTAVDRSEILARLADVPLRIGQIDVNGKCNAKCWYCPVKYEGNPGEFAVQMSPAELDAILGNLRASPLIPADFRFLYSCHYNEVLLYKHFAEMLAIFRKHRFATSILSNGTPLTPEKTDLILANKDVVWGITLNVPALDEADWAKKAGLPASRHRLLLRNLDYLHERYPATLQINCATSHQGMLDNAMANTPEEAEAIADAFRARYPNFRISLQQWLSDRAGKLADNAVLTHNQQARRQIIGCSHSSNEGGRVFGWVHINARSELFLCCDDFDMEYRFGNLKEQPFADAWLSEAHVDAILRSRAGICQHCQFRMEGST